MFKQDFIVANMSYPPATTQTLSGVVPDGYAQMHGVKHCSLRGQENNRRWDPIFEP